MSARSDAYLTITCAVACIVLIVLSEVRHDSANSSFAIFGGILLFTIAMTNRTLAREIVTLQQKIEDLEKQIHPK
jgi:hypothetical protein